MTRYLFPAMLLIASSLSFSSCKKVVGDGPIVHENRILQGFDEIHLAMDAHVNLIQDSYFEVELVAQQNVLDQITTSVNGTTLCIDQKPNVYIKTKTDIQVNIHLPKLCYAKVSGSGSIHAVNDFITNDLHLTVSGSGTISMPYIDALSLKSDISGSGKVTIGSGLSNSLSSCISGSGDLDARQVQVNTVETETSGSGTTRVWATQSLDVKISGSGNVYFKGYPSVHSKISGSGDLIHIN